MDRVHSATSESARDASFDTLARTLGRRLPRRQALTLLAATLVTGALGTAAHSADAAGKNKVGSEPVGPVTTPPSGPTASETCLVAGNQCGTKAGVQGACRHPAAADNQAGLLCTSNQAGNECTASTQCGPGTRCAGFPVPNCRVVID
jgi:hypothetical protein